MEGKEKFLFIASNFSFPQPNSDEKEGKFAFSRGRS